MSEKRKNIEKLKLGSYDDLKDHIAELRSVKDTNETVVNGRKVGSAQMKPNLEMTAKLGERNELAKTEVIQDIAQTKETDQAKGDSEAVTGPAEEPDESIQVDQVVAKDETGLAEVRASMAELPEDHHNGDISVELKQGDDSTATPGVSELGQTGSNGTDTLLGDSDQSEPEKKRSFDFFGLGNLFRRKNK